LDRKSIDHPGCRLCGGAGPFRHKLFAWFMARFGHNTERYLAQYKSRLFAAVRGTVLEIGPGAGANLHHLAGKDIRWVGLEPNPYMARHLRAEAARVGVSVDLVSGAAENLPFRCGSVDVVISTLVLCSVVDQAESLREIYRVLKPGGQLVYIEHVAGPAGSWIGRVQRIIKPFWRRMGDGCNPDRQTAAAIQEMGFASVHVERFNAPLPIVKPHIAGFAVKR
jgi:ubiquinone/menaquinone biosynthesis C-methylase UbiE